MLDTNIASVKWNPLKNSKRSIPILPIPLDSTPKRSHFFVFFFCPGVHPCLRADLPLLCPGSAWLNSRVQKAISFYSLAFPCLHRAVFLLVRHHPSNVGDSENFCGCPSSRFGCKKRQNSCELPQISWGIQVVKTEKAHGFCQRPR